MTLAQHLERATPSGTQITLISSENYLVFSPMLAEAVGRTVSPLHIVVPGRQMVQKTTWLTASATEIDLAHNEVHYLSAGGERGSTGYDHLILACGSVVNLNDVPGLAAYAYPLKTMGDAIALGNDLLGRLEEASVESDPAQRRRLLTVVVIGGGFSGVEVSGEISELMRKTRVFYPELQGERERIILLHRGDRILPELNAPSLSEFALKKLREEGVDVRLQAEAQEVTEQDVRLKSGEKIESSTIVCTVGTATNPLIRALGLPLEKDRLKTDPDMRVTGASNVWAIGDCAAIPNAHDGKTSPPTAQFATRQARQLAANIARVIRGESAEPFKFKPLGMLASLGHHNAVAEILGLHLSGFVAWFLWRGIYLAKLPTLARKLEVAIDWAWQLFFAPNIVQLQMSRTNRVGRAHYAAGEFVYRKGDPGNRFYVVQSGAAGVYLDEGAPPVSMLKPGDHFGEGALMSPDSKGMHSVSVKAETALDLVTLNRDDFTRLSDSLGVLHQEMRRSALGRRGYLGLQEIVQKEPRLASLKVSDVMSSPAETLDAGLTLEEAIERFHGGRPGYPVVDESGLVVGYCGRAELYDALRGLIPVQTPVSEFMRKDAPVVSADQSLVDAVVALMRERVEVMPVVSATDRRKVAGVLSPIDVFRKAIEAR